MNVVYRCEWTEYEQGMGSRPDGVTYAMSEILLDEEIKRQEGIGDYSCYSRASDKGLCIVNDELAKKIHEHGGVFNTWKGDDPGMLGLFVPGDPKANVETYRKQFTQAPAAA